jgi:hypothetical protein
VSGKNLDGQVVRHPDEELSGLLDQFVCVRLVQCFPLDLTVFQVDFSMAWSSVLMNGDGAVYGRYGTRIKGRDNESLTLNGFKAALRGALVLHALNPITQNVLKGKRNPRPVWKTPKAIPGLARRFGPAETDVRRCLHCHFLGAAKVMERWRSGKTIRDRHIWNFPPTATVGLKFDPQERATVRSVTMGSRAAQAGILAGDKVFRMDGQPILSIADVTWVLHRAPERGAVKAQILRGDRRMTVTLDLQPGWRRLGDVAWRLPLWHLRNQVLGMHLTPVSSGETPRFRIHRLTPPRAWGRNPSPAKVGLRARDTIAKVDGRAPPKTDVHLIAYILQERKPGDRVRYTVHRGDRTLEFEVTVR